MPSPLEPDSERQGTVDPRAVALARRVVGQMGGRFSTEAGIDLDGGPAEVERWFLAATLFGTRISAAVALRTFEVLLGAGLTRVGQAAQRPWGELVALLDEGGYARYDARTATRLQALSEVVAERYGGEIASLGRRLVTYPDLRSALDALPGWGPVTVQLFLRELRGVWPGATPPFDERAADAAAHLRLLTPRQVPEALGRMVRLGQAAGLDVRDLEGGLVRLALAHRGDLHRCPGGSSCPVLRARGERRRAG